FSKRTSPVQWAGPKRVRKPGLEIDQLPKIDVVLVSHNHYDHMDADSIKALTEKFNPLFITPLGNTKLIQSLGGKRVTELDWWQETFVPLEGSAQVVKVGVVPAQHWSKRGLFDTNKALWGGFVLQTSKAKIYFSGDTGYAGFFKSIFEKYGPMDLSIIAIGAYEPRWFMKEQHMNPAEAVQAHMDLHSKRTLGTHFGTFQLTDEAIDEPKLALERDLIANKILKGVFTAPDNGETLKLNVE
ncbi:MAG: MBL fold metallo-hydrolase, partial [Proteobacteria bacterium]